MVQLVAFLRGINLGKRTVKMDDLRKAFEGMGFSDARTLLASGNVLFETERGSGLEQTIEAGLKNAFGFDIGTIIRSIDELKGFASNNPFDKFEVDKDTKFYTLFLAQPDAHKLDYPTIVPGDFEVVWKTDRDIFAVAFRMENGRFGAGLDKLVKTFGKGVTMRNWNTVLKLIEKGAA